MHSTKNISLLLFALVLVCFSCEDDPLEITDTRQPTFQIEQPTMDAEYRSNEPIKVAVAIADDNELASYKIVVRNLATDELVFIESQTTEEREVAITGEFTVSVAELTDFRLEIDLEDAAGNETNATRRFAVLPPPGATLELNFRLQYQDEPLVLFQRYDYETMRVFFTRFSTYLSDIKLTNGTNEVLVREVDFLDLTTAHETAADAANGFNYQISGVPTGEYDGLAFTIGVNEQLNAQTPADFPPSSPLSKSGEYWSSWQSYIFQKTEAKLDSDGDADFETEIALHTGSDAAARTIKLDRNVQIANNNIATINLTIDIYDMLVNDGTAYDLENDNQIHSLSQMELIQQLADNLVDAIE